MLFADKLTLDKPRRTADGYLVSRAKAARTGVYRYTGTEIDPNNDHGLRDQAIVNVLRDDATVFDKKAVHSFIGKPITNDHPSVAVNADNWKDHARGVIMGALKDGEHLAFDLLLTDAAAIADVEGGKRELSAGYAAELAFGDFEAADGTKCQAKQTAVRGNHLAIVACGRAGSECAIADAARCSSLPADVFELLTDERTYNNEPNNNTKDPTNVARQSGDIRMHTLMIDGLQVTEVSDQAKAAIEKLQGQVRDASTAKSTAEATLADANTTIAARDAEIVTLKQAVEDAKVTPAQLRDQAKAYALVCDKAKALDVKFAEDADADMIMKAVVDAKMGDAAKDYDAKQIAAAFAVLTKDAKPRDPVRDAISSGVETIGDAKAEYEKSREKQVAALRDAYKTPANAA